MFRINILLPLIFVMTGHAKGGWLYCNNPKLYYSNYDDGDDNSLDCNGGSYFIVGKNNPKSWPACQAKKDMNLYFDGKIEGCGTYGSQDGALFTGEHADCLATVASINDLVSNSGYSGHKVSCGHMSFENPTVGAGPRARRSTTTPTTTASATKAITVSTTTTKSIDDGGGDVTKKVLPLGIIVGAAAGTVVLLVSVILKRRNKSKFVATTIRLGRATQASDGLADLMGYDNISIVQKILGNGGGIDAIVTEINAHGTEEDKKNVRTLLDGTYTNPPDSKGALPTPEDGWDFYKIQSSSVTTSLNDYGGKKKGRVFLNSPYPELEQLHTRRL
eukprot:gene22215-14876_t